MKAGKLTAAAVVGGGLGLATIETTWNITTWIDLGDHEIDLWRDLGIKIS